MLAMHSTGHIRDITQNINQIVDINGTIMVKYSYTAFGIPNKTTGDNLTETESLIASELMEHNIYLYKGYCYDYDNEIYYLNSRFYDPEIGRFISPDSPDYLDPSSIGGLNLYVYCRNNPVMLSDSYGTSPKWWQTILIGVGIIVGAALVATAIAFTGGTAAAFLGMWGTAIVGGLKIAAVAGVTAGVIRAGSTAIGGGSLGDVGKSFVTGFADGFFAGSVYAGGSMILSAGAFRIAGLFNNGYGWSSGKWLGGYQTPNTPGISFGTFKGGPIGGRSFGFDLDMYHAFHFHSKILGKGSVKTHRWMFAPIMIGIGVGFSDPWSEW